MREDPDRKKNIWFPAKKYGWGWGPPRTWQGWVFLLGWCIAMTAGTLAILALSGVGGGSPDLLLFGVLFTLFAGGMLWLLIAVCRAKGEPPRWQWGGK